MTNLLGANLPTGLAASMAGGPPGVPAVLEVDEAWLGRGPRPGRGRRLLLLLNLSRDQLDRNNEVRHVAQRVAPGVRTVADGQRGGGER